MSDTSGGGAKGSGKTRDPVEQARETLKRQVVEPATRAGEAMRASGKTWAEGSARISLTLIDQAERNLHDAFAAMRQAAKAKDLSEVMTLQTEFLRRQGSRAMEQAREVGELIVEIGRQAATPLSGAASQTKTPADPPPAKKPAAKGAQKR